MPDTFEDPVLPDWLVLVQKSVESLKFGEVQITVHNGEIVQVTRTETTRVEPIRTKISRKAKGPQAADFS